MHIYIHTFMHTYIHAYIHSCTYIHTKNHLYTIASTTLILDSTKFPKNVIPSVNTLQVSGSTNRRFTNTHFIFPHYLLKFYPFYIAFTFILCLALLQWQQTPTLPFVLPCFMLSNNDSRHQHCLVFYLVFCSPLMTADTNIAFSFTLCLALQQW